MTSLITSLRLSFVASLLAVAIVCGAFLAVVETAHADDGWGGSFDVYEGSGDSFDTYSGWGDSFDTYAGYGDSFDTYSGWGDSFDAYAGYGDSFDTYSGWGDSFDTYAGYGDSFDTYSGWGDSFDVYGGSGGFLPDEAFMPDDAFIPDEAFIPDATGVMYSYRDYYSPGCGGGCRVLTPPPAPCCAQSTPIVAPRYASSYPSFPPISYPPQRPQPASPVVTTPTSHVTTNTCTGGSCNTNVNNIDNSINSSFNTTQLAPATPQYLVQYTTPTPILPPPPIYPQQGLYCVITASPSSVQNGQAAILSWTSYGASYATLSDGIGVVAPNGTLAVRPNISTTYTLTITGYGGVRSCTTYVTVSGMVPYVSLSQIPYTGFDFGTFGNAIYWIGLLAFALSGAYLVLYYKGGTAAFAGLLFGRRNASVVRATSFPTMFTKSQTPTAFAPKPAVRVLETLPIAHDAVSPKDSMTFAGSKNGEAPRIVVNRS